MKLKAHITGNIPQGAVPVFQYSHQGENDATPTVVDVTTTSTGYDLTMADREISVNAKDLHSQFASNRTVKYRFGMKVGNDTYWGAQSNYGPKEEPYELYHALQITASTTSVSITLLHPLHTDLQMAVRENGATTLQKLTRSTNDKFSKTGITLSNGTTFTYAILDADDAVLYESLPFNLTTP